jgi:hypothetical protein
VLDPGDMMIFKYAFSIPGIAPSGPYDIFFSFMNLNDISTSCSALHMDL